MNNTKTTADFTEPCFIVTPIEQSGRDKDGMPVEILVTYGPNSPRPGDAKIGRNVPGTGCYVLMSERLGPSLGREPRNSSRALDFSAALLWWDEREERGNNVSVQPIYACPCMVACS